tara:strand:- start:719 stop:1057 length:339 start_codon:yes stop_codon:yes gene_type:complete
MRKNTQAVLDAWIAKEAKGNRGDSISTDGNTIYSYNTAIVVRTPDYSKEIAFMHSIGYPEFTQDTFVFATINTTKYSSTTSNQQSSLLAYFEANNRSYNEEINVPIGTTTLG